MNDICTLVINNNAGDWQQDDNGVVGPPEDVLNAICPEDCNSKGTCTLGLFESVLVCVFSQCHCHG